MDINDEKEIGRRLRDLAAECGFDLMPGGFQIVVDLDNRGNNVVAHLILMTTTERIEEVLADKSKPDEQKEIDAMFKEITRGAARNELQEKADQVRREIEERLRNGEDDFLG